MQINSSELVTPLTRFLRLCASIRIDDSTVVELKNMIIEISDWSDLASCAELHGIAPLVYSHIKSHNLSVPPENIRPLSALVIRHRNANKTRLKYLKKIVSAMHGHGIEIYLLKGSALAYTLYRSPELRPMRDIDLLVPKNRAALAQQVLSDMGFDSPSVHSKRVMRDHHHLPMATLKTEDLLICVEIHYDALSNDRSQTISTENLNLPIQEIMIDGHTFKTLGHTDTIKHLCYHAFEPASNLKLIMASDIIGYAEKYYGSIDWQQLRKHHPMVVNSITLLDYLTPLPEKLSKFRSDSNDKPPSGIGKCITPLSQILVRRNSIKKIFSDLYYPSDWWLRANFGVPPNKTLFWCRWITHTVRITQWLLRRLIAIVNGGLKI